MDQLNIKSEYVFISSSVDDVNIMSGKDINNYSAGSIIHQTGDPTNLLNRYIINSQNIILGIQPNLSIDLEPVVKSDQLIEILKQMLSIMNDITNNPSEVKAITGEILQVSSSLSNIKSTITKTY